MGGSLNVVEDADEKETYDSSATFPLVLEITPILELHCAVQ